MFSRTSRLTLAQVALRFHTIYFVHVSLPRGRARGFTSAQTAEGAFRFLEANGVTGRMFDDPGSGAYLVWRGGPSRAVFVDPRPGLYDAGVLEDARNWTERWPTLDATYRFDYAVIENAGAGYPAQSLDADRNWGLAYFDDATLVYLRKGGPNDRVLKHGIFRALRPNRWSDPVDEPALADPAGRRALLEETARALADAPGSALPALVRAYALERLGDRDGSAAMLGAARQRGLWKAEHRALEARVMELSGRWPEAVKLYHGARLAAERSGERLVESSIDYRLASGWGARGDARRARNLAQRALGLDPANDDARTLLRKL